MAQLRECKCIVRVEALQAGQPYRQRLVTQGRCADHALQRVKEHVRNTMASLDDVKLFFHEWLPFDSQVKLDVAPTALLDSPPKVSFPE